jgi:chitinase
VGIASLTLACGSSSRNEGVDVGGDAAASVDAGLDAVTESTPSSDAMSPSNAWVMGYYPSWDSPANGGSYAVTSIDWDGLTHVAAAFYVPDGKGGWESGYFDDATATSLIGAAHSHGKKAIASIGGSGTGAGFEGSMGTSYQSTFLASLAALVTLGYDGLDIDWEGGNLTVTEDQALETTLIDSIRTQSPTIVLTMTAGYENENALDDLSFYGTIISQLDRLNLMTYGMSGAWQGWQSWHSSPLHWDNNTSTPTGIDASVSHYLAVGVPAAKLGVGSGFYGECYTSPVTAPSQALGGSQLAASDGTMSYAAIMDSYYTPSAYHYDSASAAPYLTLSGSNAEKCTYVSYEDATSLATKAAWVKSQGLGGLIIWTISEGYVASGANVPAQNPLLETLKTSLLQ